MSELEAGDVVELKSGGPPMTIEWINRKNPSGVFARLGAYCSWSGKNGKIEGRIFAESALKKVDSKD